MINYVAERFFHRIGEIDDSFLEEALVTDLKSIRAAKRKRFTQGAAGAVVVTGVAVIAIWRLRKKKIA